MRLLTTCFVLAALLYFLRGLGTLCHDFEMLPR
jgi:hypothetical protein